jgi:hypothetical protein
MLGTNISSRQDFTECQPFSRDSISMEFSDSFECGCYCCCENLYLNQTIRRIFQGKTCRTVTVDNRSDTFIIYNACELAL